MPAELAQAVNQLRIEVGLEPRRLRTTSEALEAVWAAQRRLFGQPDQEEEEEEEEEERRTSVLGRTGEAAARAISALSGSYRSAATRK